MELNDYNGFEDHCKNAEIDLKGKFVQKDSHSIDTMEQIMQRKEQEFIDHTLLAPEYMRDPNHFIMDLMNFPKTENSTHNNGDNLATDLHFHNSLFPVGNDDHQHDTDSRKTPPNTVFMPINNNFLIPVQKTYNTAVGSVSADDDNGVKVVQQLLLSDSNVTLDDTSIDDDCDITRFNSRKVLPHKKRISRKLKINYCASELQLNVPLNDHKLPHVDQLVVGAASMQQFRCEICGHATCSQLEFFAHLKQHYEPTTPDTILAAMKTSLDVLSTEKTAEELCAIKKTDGLDQVFQDVHFPFENFNQNGDVVSVRVVMEPQHHQHETDALAEARMNVATSSLQQHNQPQQQQTQPNLVPEEFSDTEDMLEGIRDKVLIEDTCDTMDLMTPTSNGVRPHWFTNNCFNGIDLKTKPFCDVLFSGQFAPILNHDATVPLLQSEPHLSTGKIMHRDLGPDPPELTPSASAQAPSILTQPVQNPSDLNLQFSHPQTSLHNNEQCFVQDPQHHTPLPSHHLNEQQILQTQHIKIEVTPPPVTNIPHLNSEDTLSGNELEPEEDFHHQENADTDDEYINHLDQEREIKPLNRIKMEDGNESVFDDNGEEICSENEQNDENGKRKRYICYKCQRIFNSCNALKYHNRTHSGLRPHQCEICDKSFFAIGALKAHTRTHTGDKPFECEHCDRKFRQWGDLKYHTISIHSTEKNHQCEFCGKAFSRKYSLVVHLRIHTSERNYKCEFCTKTFRASTYLQNHRKIHTGEKPYECEVCSKRFRVSGDLRRHERIHERKKQKEELMKKETESEV